MDRKQLKRIQKQNTSKFNSENDNGYCWYDSLSDEPIVVFQKGDSIALRLQAWKPNHPWSDGLNNINKNPIKVEEANQFGEVFFNYLEECNQTNSYEYCFYIKFKKKITSEEFIPVIYTLTNNLMNEENVHPRQHWIEKIEKLKPNNENEQTYWYSLAMGT